MSREDVRTRTDWPLSTRLCAVALLFLFAGGTAPAQTGTTLTWTGGGGNTDWFTATNWNPNGTPGVAGSTGNMDRALFDTAGTSVTAANLNSGFNLGAIATTGASGGTLTANFSGNGALTLNGGYTVGSFTNVAAAAQNGRDLIIAPMNMSFAFGTPGNPTTFYADAGRTLAVATQQVTDLGGNVNKEGAGTLILGESSSVVTLQFGGVAININAGTLATRDALNNVTQINVAAGATLQAGLGAGGTLSTTATVAFVNNSNFRIVTNGTAVSELQNAAVTKGASDTFNVVLTGLNPTGTQTFTPNALIIQANSLTGFDPNGTYTQSSPGHFALRGDGFVVTGWSLTVLNNTQVRLDSVTVTPVPDPGVILAVGAIGLAATGLVRRSRCRSAVG
jgi:hypothetical protein